MKRMRRDQPGKQWIDSFIRVSDDLMARVDEVAVAADRAPVSGFGGQLPSSPGGKIDSILRLVAEAPHGRLSFR
jgi:hypothetical protein